jgi:LacI family transcriptional regulator
VEHALILLENEGLIVRKARHGVFVRSKAPHADRLRAIGFFKTWGGEVEDHSLYWITALSGIRAEASRRGYYFTCVPTDASNIPEMAAGLILLTDAESRHALLGAIPAGMPFVSVIYEYPEATSIVADDAGGIKAAVRHLVGLGHKRIGIVMSGFSVFVGTRVRAYKAAMAEAGIEPSLLWVRQLEEAPGRKEGTFDEFGELTVEHWLNTDWKFSPCTAVLAHNDATAIGMIKAFTAAGIRTPQDISIVGYDGTAQYRYFTPELTTVEVPLAEIGALAAQKLISLVETGGAEIEKILVPTRLHVGASTAPPSQAKK